MKLLAARSTQAEMIKQRRARQLAIEDLIDHAMRYAILALPADFSVAVARCPFANPQQAIAFERQHCRRRHLDQAR